MSTTQSNSSAKENREVAGLGPVFCHDDQETMNVAALLTYLQNLKRAGKTVDVVEFALEEAQDLHEGGNESVAVGDFSHEVGLRVLSTLE